MLKVLLNVIGVRRQDHDTVVDGNQERALPQRWRDPPPKPAARHRTFSLRAH